jgi:hypothetical protein
MDCCAEPEVLRLREDQSERPHSGADQKSVDGAEPKFRRRSEGGVRGGTKPQDLCERHRKALSDIAFRTGDEVQNGDEQSFLPGQAAPVR